MAPKIKLTYFDIEGVAEAIRLALELTGTEFEDDRISWKDWQELKPKTPYGQLPLMTIDDGPTPRTQSKAMLRWVGTVCGKGMLYPTDKQLDIEEAVGLVEDVIRSWSPCLYIGMRPETHGHPEGFSKTEEGKNTISALRKKWISKELPKLLGYFQDMIEKAGGKWLVEGENPSIADCMLVPVLRNYTRGHIDYVEPNCLETHPKMVEYVKRFCALPQIQGRYTNGLI